VTRFYDARMAPAGLKTSQYTVLRTLDATGPRRQHDLADALSADQTTMSRVLGPLERQGWIAARVGDDRRERFFSLTPAGKLKLAAAEPLWRRAQHDLKAKLDAHEWDALRSAVSRLTAAAV
jgi:DNA-binding MarR family transcriptional regulator